MSNEISNFSNINNNNDNKHLNDNSSLNKNSKEEVALYSNYINDIKKKIHNEIPESFFNKITYALDRLSEAFDSNPNFEKENIFLSFNGGKDCLAAYILLNYYLYCCENNLNYANKSAFEKFAQGEKSNRTLKNSKNIKFVYFANKKNFECEEDYVFEFCKKENVELFVIYADYILGLNFLIQNFGLRSIIMGTRADDIKNGFRGSEHLIHESTAPYPHFFRFYPVFNFDYEEIWRLILLADYNYLELYDQGFSSIGNKFNTKVNENLIFEINGAKQENLLLPAWCLKDIISERSFREAEEKKHN